MHVGGVIHLNGIQTRVLIPMYALCFVNYKDDILDGCCTEWIKCACSGRWLHFDCAEDCITDQNGKDVTVLLSLYSIV